MTTRPKTAQPELEPGHYCYYVPVQDPAVHGGFVPSLVVEHTSGHYPMLGNGPCAAPWIWGKTHEDAQSIADRYNTEQLNLSPERVTEIVASSMGRSRIGVS